MRMDRNPKCRKIYWKQIIIIISLIIIFSGTMLHAVILTEDMNFENKSTQDFSSQIVLITKDEQKLILEKLNTGDSILETDIVNGRICFKISGNTENDVCFVIDENNMSRLEWVGVEDGKDNFHFDIQPAIRIDPLSGELQYRDGRDYDQQNNEDNEDNEWHSFHKFFTDAESSSVGAKDQILSDNRVISMNSNSLTFAGTGNVVIDSDGNITTTSNAIFNDVTVNGSLKIIDNENNYIIIDIPDDISSDYTFVLPQNMGESNQVLSTDGTGKTFWQSAITDTNLGNNDQTLNESRIVYMDNNSLTFTGTKDVVIDGNGNINIGGNTKINRIADIKGTGILENTLNVNNNVNIESSSIIMGNDKDDIVTIKGLLYLKDVNSGDHNINISVSPDITEDYSLVLPEEFGEPFQILQTNGNGILSWASTALDTNLGANNQTLSQIRTIDMNGNNLMFKGETENIIIDADGNIIIGGYAIIKDNLLVLGETNLKDTLTVKNAVILNNSLEILGNTKIEGTLKVIGPVNLKETLNVNNDAAINGSTILGNNNNVATIKGHLKLGDNTDYISIKIPPNTEDYTLTLPENNGEPSQVLITNGNGITSWGFGSLDTSIGNTQQSLEEMRTINMNNKSLTFAGVKDIIIDRGGNINIEGNTKANDSLDVTGHANFQDTLNVAGDITIGGNTTLGDNDDITTINGSIKLVKDNNGEITIKAPADMTKDYTFFLPQNSGSHGQVLASDGTGITSWVDMKADSNLGDNDQTLAHTRLINMFANNLVFEAIKNVVITSDGDIDIGGNTKIDQDIEVQGTVVLKDQLNVTGPVLLEDNLDVVGDSSIEKTFNVKRAAILEDTLEVNNHVIIGGSTTLGDDNDVTNIKGSLTLNDGNNNNITIQVPTNMIRDYTLVLPKESGVLRQVLINKGNGITSWQSATTDTNFGNNDQTLDQARTVEMNGNNLIFDGAKDTIINGSGSINIDGDTDIADTLKVIRAANFESYLQVKGATSLNNALEVSEDTSLEGSLKIIDAAVLDNTLNVDGDVTINGSTKLGDYDDITTINGSLKIADTNDNYITIKAPFPLTNDYTFVLPQDNGMFGQMLITDGTGKTFWEFIPSDTYLGNSDQTLTEARIITMNANDLIFDGIKNVVITADGNIDIGQNASVGNTLEVLSMTSLQDMLTVDGPVDIDDDLDVLGDIKIGGTLEVARAVDLHDMLSVNNNVTVDGSVILGEHNDVTTINGSLQILNDNGNHITIKAPSNSTSYNFLLPSEIGTLNQVLMSNGKGKTYWESVTGDINLGNTNQTLTDMRIVDMNGKILTFSGTKDIILQSNGDIEIGSNASIGGTLDVEKETILKDTLTVNDAITLNNKLDVKGATTIKGTLQVMGAATLDKTLEVNNNVNINGSTTLGNNNEITTINGPLKISDDRGNYITIESPSYITDYTFVLPESIGRADQTLVTDGTGKTSWKSIVGDTYLGSHDQTLLEDRTVNMNGKKLTFQGTSQGTSKNIIIYDNGNMNIGGNGIIGGDFEVTGVANVGDTLTVSGATTLNNELNVSDDTNLKGTLEVTGTAILEDTLYVVDDTIINGSTILGDNNSDIVTINGSLKISNNNNKHIIIKAPDSITEDYTLILPTADGTLGQILVADGTGKTFWEDPMTNIKLGTHDQILSENRIVNMSEKKLTFQGTSKDIIIYDNGDINIGGNTNLFGSTFQVGGTTILNDEIIVEKAVSLNNTLDVKNDTIVGGNFHVTETATLDNNLSVLDNVTINGSTTLGNDNTDITTINGIIKLADNNVNYITIKAPDSVVSYTLTLPDNDGEPSYILISDGTGRIYWGKPGDDTYLGINEQTLTDMRTINMDGYSLTFDGTKDVVIDDIGNINISGSGTIQGDFEAIKATVLNDKLTVAKAASLNDKLNVAGNTVLNNKLNVTGAGTLEDNLNILGDVTINGLTELGNDNTDITTINGSLEFYNNTGNYITIKAPNSIASYNLILPMTAGVNNQILTTNGHGATNWASAVTDTSLATNDQDLSGNRVVDMNGNQLQIQGTTNVMAIHDNGNIDIQGNGIIQGDFEAIGAVTLNNTLTVDGASILNNNLNVSGETNLKGTLQVTGAGTITDTLDVTDDVIINGSSILGDDNIDETIIKGSLKLANSDATKYVTIKSPASITSYPLALPVDNGGQNYVLASDGLGGTIWAAPIIDTYLGNSHQSLTGNRTVNMDGNNLTFQSTAGDIIIYDNGDINIDGKGTIAGTFEVAGVTALNDTLTVEKAVHLQDTLTVKNKSAMESNLQVKEPVTLENSLTVGDNVTINGSNIILGNDNNDVTTIKGSLKIADNASNYISLKAPDSIANDYTFVLPVNHGDVGQVLAIDTSGQTYWTFVGVDTNIGNSTQVLTGNRTVTMDGNNLTFNGTTGSIVIYDNGNMDVDGKGTIAGTFEVGGVTALNDTLKVEQEVFLNDKLDVTNNSTIQGNLDVTGTATLENTLNITDNMTINGSITLGDTNSDIITINGSVKLFDRDGSNYISLKAPDSLTSAYTFVLPLDFGQKDQVLKTDGNGVTYWEVAAKDTNIGNINQILTEPRTVTMDGHTLTFANTTKNIVIDENGSITMRNFDLAGDLQVTGPAILQGVSNTIEGASEFKGNLHVEEGLKGSGTLDIYGEANANTLNIRDLFDVKGSATFGVSDNSIVGIVGTFKLMDENGVFVRVKPASRVTDESYTFVLPGNAPTDSYFLYTDGAGVTSWKKWIDKELGNTNLTLTHDRVIYMDGNDLTFQGTSENIVIYEDGDINPQIDGKATIAGNLEVTGQATIQNDLIVEQKVSLNNDLSVQSHFIVNGKFETQGNTKINNNKINIHKKSSETSLDSTGGIIMKNEATIKFYNNNDKFVGIKAPSEITSEENFLLHLPKQPGAANQVLVSNGGQELYWKTPDFTIGEPYDSGFHQDDCEKWNQLTGDDTVYINIDGLDISGPEWNFGFCIDQSPRTTNGTSWVDANDFCLSRGMHIPTYFQWRVSCDPQTYGTVGNTEFPITANHWEWASPYISLLENGGSDYKLGTIIAGGGNCNVIFTASIDEAISASGEGILFRCAR